MHVTINELISTIYKSPSLSVLKGKETEKVVEMQITIPASFELPTTRIKRSFLICCSKKIFVICTLFIRKCFYCILSYIILKFNSVIACSVLHVNCHWHVYTSVTITHALFSRAVPDFSSDSGRNPAVFLAGLWPDSENCT